MSDCASLRPPAPVWPPAQAPPLGPPPELVEACRGKTIGDPCAFVLGGRRVEGFCGKDRHDVITCPAGGVRYGLRQKIERLFPMLAAGAVFIAGVAGGTVLRVAVGRHWATLLPLVVLALVPWWWHHQEILRFSEAQGASIDGLQKVRVAGLAAVDALTTVALVLARKAPVLVAAIPGSAFLVTWYLTFPLAHAAVPDGYLTFDNVPNVWLFIASVGGTGVLLAYGFRWFGRALRRKS